MQISRLNWMQVESYLTTDDRCVLPLGSIEQHAYLSLATDALLAERISIDAAEPIGVPVFPVLNYGFTPYFTAYPGTVTLTLETYFAVVRDLITGLHGQGFKRIVIVNGHGGNAPVASLTTELMAEHLDLQVKFHNWWNAPRTLAFVRQTKPGSSHASWMENLPWTRVAGIDVPGTAKTPLDTHNFAPLNPLQTREILGDGNYGGSYARPDEYVLRMWDIAVEETREVIEGQWRKKP